VPWYGDNIEPVKVSLTKSDPPRSFGCNSYVNPLVLDRPMNSNSLRSHMLRGEELAASVRNHQPLPPGDILVVIRAAKVGLRTMNHNNNMSTGNVNQKML
jgi:hypothetical protein